MASIRDRNPLTTRHQTRHTGQRLAFTSIKSFARSFLRLALSQGLRAQPVCLQSATNHATSEACFEAVCTSSHAECQALVRQCKDGDCFTSVATFATWDLHVSSTFGALPKWGVQFIQLRRRPRESILCLCWSGKHGVGSSIARAAVEAHGVSDELY